MATTEFYPVMHCNEQDFNGVFSLAERIVTKGLYMFPLVFTHPTILQADFTKNLTIFSGYIGSSKNNHDNIELRTKY